MPGMARDTGHRRPRSLLGRYLPAEAPSYAPLHERCPSFGHFPFNQLLDTNAHLSELATLVSCRGPSGLLRMQFIYWVDRPYATHRALIPEYTRLVVVGRSFTKPIKDNDSRRYPPLAVASLHL